MQKQQITTYRHIVIIIIIASGQSPGYGGRRHDFVRVWRNGATHNKQILTANQITTSYNIRLYVCYLNSGYTQYIKAHKVFTKIGANKKLKH